MTAQHKKTRLLVSVLIAYLSLSNLGYSLSNHGYTLAATPATKPQATVNTALPAGWDGHADAAPANAAELQAALANAVQDSGTHIIELAAGTTYTGNFVIDSKPGTDWLIIRAANFAKTNRVVPADAPNMAKLQSPNGNALMRLGFGAHHIRFIGVEFAVSEPTIPIVLIGANVHGQSPTQANQIAHHVGFDRCWIHSASDVNRARVGLHVSANHFFVINSRIENIKDGADAQAIYSASSQGPHLIENNYLEATGEIIMYGGDSTSVDNLIGSDITIRRNHFSKRPSWDPNGSEYNGINWGVKNLFELKNARRVHLHSNVMENSWVDSQAAAIVLTPRSGWSASGVLNPWAEVKDVTIENNLIRNVGRLFVMLGEDYFAQTETCERVTIRNNLIHSQGTAQLSGRSFHLTTALNKRPVKDVIIDHNTIVFTRGTVGDTNLLLEQDGTVNVDRLDMTNNIFDAGRYDMHSGLFHGKATNVNVSGNGIYYNPMMDAYGYWTEPNGNFEKYYPNEVKANSIDAVGFTDHANHDYTLEAGSPFHGKGVDFTVLNAAIDGVVDGAVVVDPEDPEDPEDPPEPPPSLIDQLKALDITMLTPEERHELSDVLRVLQFKLTQLEVLAGE